MWLCRRLGRWWLGLDGGFGGDLYLNLLRLRLRSYGRGGRLLCASLVCLLSLLSLVGLVLCLLVGHGMVVLMLVHLLGLLLDLLLDLLLMCLVSLVGRLLVSDLADLMDLVCSSGSLVG